MGIELERNTERKNQQIWTVVAKISRDPMLLIGIILLGMIILCTVLGPYVVWNDPVTVNMSDRLLEPSLQYPLGTDHLGRCIFSRLIEGAQITLGITSIVLVSIMLIGVPIGLLSGYIGGRFDSVLMRLVDGFIAFPEFILAIAITGFLGPSMTNIVIAIVLVKWISYARMVRSIVLSEKEKEYILSARVSGSSTLTVIMKHLFPQIISPVLVLATLDMGKIILLISSLSYLGLGAQAPTPEWGAMLNDARPYFQTIPELMIYPGVAIMLVVLSCNLIGDGLREVLDIKRT
ncbi:nickel transporter permease [Caldalkalibacillus mannanilyticus]|uniref:nickel transporter permease n=1 Tax=Caldalkalibacillus mannanilyticus TaxID=1418 RepID=UPI0006842C83|nr:nickel transporter permease [Caldalkalibacillus mannanilyticus]